MEHDLHYESCMLFSNPENVEDGAPVALAITARVLCQESFAIHFSRSTPVCRITSTRNPPGMHPKWDPSLPPFKSRRGKRQPLRYHPGSKGMLYMYKGPDTLVKLSEFFVSNRFLVVLIGTCPKVSGQKTSGSIYFLIVEPQGSAFSRAGILEIKETLETFSQDLQFKERSITIV